jgi:hypothetical protein
MKKLILFAAFITFITVGSLRANPGFHAGVTFNFFYSSLSPYGEWVELDNDLYAWRPSHINRAWMPYSVGRWEWTADGWYWDSYEPFGWATYHYGRWFNDDYYGWIWIPGYDWAPAWVEWRYNDDYVGWAPLPPYADWSVSLGIHFSISWHSPYHYWNFVHYNHFCDHEIDHYLVGDIYRNRIYNNTRYRNDYVYRDNRIINHGVDRNFVERRGGIKINEQQIVETNNLRNMGSRSRDDSRVEIYRPSDADINKTREISKMEIKRNDRKTSLEISKVEMRERTNSGNKSVGVKIRENEVEKMDKENNVNRNENRVIDRSKEIEKKNTPVENRSIDNKTRINKVEKQNNESRQQPKREVRVQENNKPGNESPRVESRTQEKRNTDIRERRNTEERKVETKRKEVRGRDSGSSNNDRMKSR